VRLARWPEGPVYRLSDEVVKETYGPEADLGFEQGNMTKPLVLLDVLLTNDVLKGASFEYDEFSRPIVDIEITTEAAERLEEATGRHVGNPMAFLIDGKVVSAPVVRSATSGNIVRIAGLSSIKEAKSIWGMLATGPLPVDLMLKSVEKLRRKTSTK
jgi:SecD/SecF fusion protein